VSFTESDMSFLLIL